MYIISLDVQRKLLKLYRKAGKGEFGAWIYSKNSYVDVYDETVFYSTGLLIRLQDLRLMLRSAMVDRSKIIGFVHSHPETTLKLPAIMNFSPNDLFTILRIVGFVLENYVPENMWDKVSPLFLLVIPDFICWIMFYDLLECRKEVVDWLIDHMFIASALDIIHYYRELEREGFIKTGGSRLGEKDIVLSWS